MHGFPRFEDFVSGKENVAVVGLGYVGLPLAVALSRRFRVIGYDYSGARIGELRRGVDRTGEVDPARLADCAARFTDDPADLGSAKVIIIAVPTPIDDHRNPDLGPVASASASVGRHMARGSVVVYESTVYPGVTEDVCVPLLERESGMGFGKDFAVGYSPERINPGDKVHTVERIVKVVSASSPDVLDLLASLYGAIVEAGVHRAASIKVAEAAKVIENTQRDINIALMNELALIFDKLGIDTLEVLEAAGTKWNFLPFRPGLVGGHCIGVDPYYLTYKAEAAGYHPEVILAGRRINDTMGKFIAEKTVKMLIAAGQRVAGAKVGIFGLTFKENVPDLRNTRVVDIKRELEEYGVTVLVHDPLADPEEAQREYGFAPAGSEAMNGLDAAVLAVAHNTFGEWNLESLKNRFSDPERVVLIDIKGLFSRQQAERASIRHYWRL